MVTKREEIDHEGLRISVRPIEEKPFYLTGETPAFRTIIRNQATEKRKGRLLFFWRLDSLLTRRVVDFELDPFSEIEYVFPREWLYREGTAIYELAVMPTTVSDNELEQYSFSNPSIHPLCSYYVRDKDLYEYEESYRRAMIIYTLIIIGLTILNIVLLYGEKIISYLKNI